MTTRLRSGLGALMPSAARFGYWFLTDSAWRQQWLRVTREVRARRRGWRTAIGPISAQTGNVVASGPFAGMKYLGSRGACDYTQKLLGTYEKEVAHVVEEICQRGYQLVVDVGAAEGYYACGLALRMRGAQMTAFESQRALHPVITDIAVRNGVGGQLQVKDTCTTDELRRALASGCLLICDIDGGEFDLLDPRRVPELLAADMLVEVHDAIRPGVSAVLTDRFAGTHDVEFIGQVPRTIEDFPTAIELDSNLAVKAMDEGRGTGNDWLWMKRSRESRPQA